MNFKHKIVYMASSFGPVGFWIEDLNSKGADFSFSAFLMGIGFLGIILIILWIGKLQNDRYYKKKWNQEYDKNGNRITKRSSVEAQLRKRYPDLSDEEINGLMDTFREKLEI